MKIRLVISKLFLADGQPYGLTVATNQVIPCGNFANRLEIFLLDHNFERSMPEVQYVPLSFVNTQLNVLPVWNEAENCTLISL
jgi:hypothetical protein